MTTKTRWMTSAVLLCAVWLPWAMAEEGAAKKPAAELVTPSIVENPEVKLLDTEGAGKLYQVGELLVCVMEGTPEEMGFQHGRLLANHAKHIMQEGYLVKALWDRGYTREYVNAQSARMEKHFPPEYVAELQGMVKGLQAAGFAEATYEDARLGVTQAELLHYDADSPPGCSNFACWGQWTKGGRLLHGRNLDWNIEGDAQDDAVVLIWRPTGGVPFMMVGWAGGIGSVSGMNAKGITIGEMTSMSPDATFDGLPLFLIMRKVLQDAKTLDEAVAIMQKGPRTTGWNFIIGDGQIPNGRALEVDAAVCEVFAPMDPKEGEATAHWAMEDAVRRTNHPISELLLNKLLKEYAPMIEEELGVKVESLEQGKMLLKLQNTWKRYDWMGKQIQAHPGAFDIPEALQILANRPVGNDGTLHSWVFDPSNQTAYIAIAGNNPPVTASSRPYTKVDMKEWFKQ
ncbi:MAG: hypothetical protein QG656_1619 [Candidatus Hydrogenedentes bacterium]|nr:hypothetical protein [Candidatus Hydrogenedentota bacterium]